MGDKRRFLILIFLFGLAFFSVGVLAENTTDIFLEAEEEYVDAELEVEAGTTPDSAFYFLDKFFDRFGDDLKIREERMAEIKVMIEEGKIEEAKEALESYNNYLTGLEKEIEPGERGEVRRSAVAITKVFKEIEKDIPEEDREEFLGVLEKEESLVTAVEIADKIQTLCQDLAKLDPVAYAETCKIGEDAPEWKLRMHEDLTKEQEEIAKDFVGIMKECFETSGQDCDCEDISFYDFSVACSKAAPLATACDIEGDEVACDELDNLEMPELPDWLQPIWEDLEQGMTEAQYNMHMPFECVEAGVTDPRECGKVMIKEHSPLECRAALLESDCDSEFECREICDNIMFEKHAPIECIDKGITSPEECGRFMDSFRGENRHFGPKGGPGFGPNCEGIKDPMERLECYDNKGNEVGEYYGPMKGMPEGEITWQCKENRIHWPPDCEVFMSEEWPEQERKRMEEGDLRRMQKEDWRTKERECANSCAEQQKPWDFSNGECVCKEREFDDYRKPYEDEWRGYDCSLLDCQQGFHCEPDYGCVDDAGMKFEDHKYDYYEESECKDGCQDECPGASRTDCINERCECYYEDKEDYSLEEEFYPPEGSDSTENYYPSGENFEEEVKEETDFVEDSPKEEVIEVETTQEEPEPIVEESGSSGITGNAFLDYYFN